MTDRVHALTVTLDRDIRVDDLEHLTGAIGMLRGVASVTEHVADWEDYTARERVRSDVGLALYRAVDGIFRGDKEILALLLREPKRG